MHYMYSSEISMTQSKIIKVQFDFLDASQNFRFKSQDIMHTNILNASLPPKLEN